MLSSYCKQACLDVLLIMRLLFILNNVGESICPWKSISLYQSMNQKKVGTTGLMNICPNARKTRDVHG